ncbi:DNA polymerase II (macronuclear) [Tetrahymena thermophila SB210]|uniref:DNA polymerase n=1 Tax=Tetrahymena thermophila (strain SB210) TaxID=312017 RepID=Q23AJ0_TETTS|nr:DNA polymerase II [Tetrahymena thermophila SB210]EAR93502.3 DNA polymerase II [Tetrahymena thermophila SB210]7UY7_E Chain E, DNA polymerase [Tetrahymena thermophila]7UY8_A Chain A, DNA polymerase [Tetrahymena thermophila]|eukprot:XP_001013747.3 DNA polymerase II [Tetrahymena thermophila SB210]
MSDKLTRLERLNKEVKKQNKLKQHSKNNRFDDDMDIEAYEDDEQIEEDDFIDDTQEDKKYKKKYREIEDEFDQEIEEEEELNKKKKTKNTILNYTNTTAVTNNKKKAISKQIPDIDIEEIMKLTERKKKIEQEEAQLLQEEQELLEQEKREEEEKKRISQEAKSILREDCASSKTANSSKGKVDQNILNAINRDFSDDSNTVDSISEFQKLKSLAQKANLANESLKQSKVSNTEINLTNLSISQVKKINDYKNEDGSVDAYLYDYFYDAQVKPDKIYAFAKVQNKQTNAFDTCVIQIDTIIRNLFFYPSSDTVTEQQIKNEIAELLKKEQTSRKNVEFLGAFVDKNYAFELPIPRGKSRWYQVVMSYEYEVISPDTKGQYFSYCVGSTYSALETFLITKKITGPSWVRFQNVKDTTSCITNRKLEFRVDYTNQSNIQVLQKQLPTPPLSVVCISLKTSQQIVLSQKKKEYKKEIFNLNMKYHEGINIDNSNKDELNQFKSISFITHIDPTKKQDSITKKGTLPETTKFCLNELNLLEQFLVHFNEIDPDIVVAHDLYSTVFEIILTRIREKGIRKWNLLSKLINIGSSDIPKYGSSTFKTKMAMKGRLLVDTLLSSQEFVNCVEYTLEALAQKLFKIEIPRIDAKAYQQKFATYKLLNSLVDDTYQDIDYALRIMYHLQIVPLTKQLTSICGNIWMGSLQNQRAERNEMLLLHKFNQLNYVYPDNFKNLPESYKKKHKNAQIRKQYEEDEDQAQGNKNPKKKENKYKGGQVFEPEKGLYNEYIVLLDFNSLYPSIIQEFNVCFTTCVRDPIPLEMQMAPFLGNKKAAIQYSKNQNTKENKMQDEDEEDNENEQIVQTHDVLPTIEVIKGIAPLPSILQYLVEQRKVVKNQIKGQKDPQVIETLDIKQKAFKLVANSMYGCLGFSSSRFYAMPLASFITAKGRHILFDSKKIVEDMGYSVIYGDTDSLMIKPGTNEFLEAVKTGLSIKIKVNSKYKKLQLDIDGVFKNMLLLKKKKYATLKVANWEEVKNTNAPEKLEKEIKGIDVVRRDWCQLSRDAGNKILEIILESKSSENMLDDIKKYLIQLNDDINQKNIKNSNYYITKRLTKRVDQYGEKNLPHVAVAQRSIQEKGIDPQTYVNQIISYIICKNEQSSRLVDKAYSPQEFITQSKSLEIDLQYYKRFQLFEPIKRMLEVIEGINLQEIASILEVHYSVQHVSQNNELNAENVLNLKSKRNQFLTSIPRVLVDCKKCDQTFLFLGILEENADAASILKCKCGNDIYIQLKNKIALVVKELIRNFEENAIQIDNEEFEYTHQISLVGKAKQQKMSSFTLNQKLLSIQAMFDITKEEQENTQKVTIEKIKTIKKTLDDLLSKSQYNNLNLSNIFTSFGLLK